MDEFIAKPMRKKVLVEKLAVLLAGHPFLALKLKPARPAQAREMDHIGLLPVMPSAEVAMADVVPGLDVEAV